MNEEDEMISINTLKTDGIFSARGIIDTITGIETSDLTSDEIDRLRPKVYNEIAKDLNKNQFIKVHDAYTYLADHTPLLGTKNAKALYIIRNPLDVAVSYANHISKSIDQSIALMGDPQTCFCKGDKGLKKQLRQKLLTWSEHVESWRNASELPVHFIHYEDMKGDPLKAFKSAVEFIGLEKDDYQIMNAINRSDFKVLKEQEEQESFKEKPTYAKSFFRKGEVGDWRNHLTTEQVEKIITDHKKIMIMQGYLDSHDQPIF
jgi:hypothetical protein